MGEKWATQTGTFKYFQWISSPLLQRSFQGLTVSALGAGTYLGAADEETDQIYEQVLIKAGLAGINFFDTAIHYRCQRSERVLKKALRELAGRGIGREQVVVATKGGYLPAEGHPENLADTIRMQYLDRGVMDPQDIVGGVHCMTPSFLETQIQASLKNLGLDCIDLYYLQNPEIQLTEIGEELFYIRLKQAFDLLEKKVQEKKIRCYGIASWNGFRQKAEQKGSLQLEKILECAESVAGPQHHMKAIQLPFNLVMTEALKLKNQLSAQGKKTLFQCAQEKGVTLMISSPLMQSQVSYLSNRLFEHFPEADSKIVQALEFVLSTPFICTAFCGMMHAEHVEQNSHLLKKPLWSIETWKQVCASIGISLESSS